MASSVLCLGCGITINHSSDRRNLCGDSSKTVLAAWKNFLNVELETRGYLAVSSESLFTIDGIRTKDHGNQKNMCRKCFYLYEKTLKSLEVCSISSSCFTYLHVGNKFKHGKGSKFSRYTRFRCAK